MSHIIGAHGAMRRVGRTRDNPYRRKAKRIDWPTVIMLACAFILTLAVLAYKFTGP